MLYRKVLYLILTFFCLQDETSSKNSIRRRSHPKLAVGGKSKHVKNEQGTALPIFNLRITIDRPAGENTYNPNGRRPNKPLGTGRERIPDKLVNEYTAGNPAKEEIGTSSSFLNSRKTNDVGRRPDKSLGRERVRIPDKVANEYTADNPAAEELITTFFSNLRKKNDVGRRPEKLLGRERGRIPDKLAYDYTADNPAEEQIGTTWSLPNLRKTNDRSLGESTYYSVARRPDKNIGRERVRMPDKLANEYTAENPTDEEIGATSSFPNYRKTNDRSLGQNTYYSMDRRQDKPLGMDKVRMPGKVTYGCTVENLADDEIDKSEIRTAKDDLVGEDAYYSNERKPDKQAYGCATENIAEEEIDKSEIQTDSPLSITKDDLDGEDSYYSNERKPDKLAYDYTADNPDEEEIETTTSFPNSEKTNDVERRSDKPLGRERGRVPDKFASECAAENLSEEEIDKLSERRTASPSAKRRKKNHHFFGKVISYLGRTDRRGIAKGRPVGEDTSYQERSEKPRRWKRERMPDELPDLDADERTPCNSFEADDDY